jgi:hypothetical protein
MADSVPNANKTVITRGTARDLILSIPHVLPRLETAEFWELPGFTAERREAVFGVLLAASGALFVEWVMAP